MDEEFEDDYDGGEEDEFDIDSLDLDE